MSSSGLLAVPCQQVGAVADAVAMATHIIVSDDSDDLARIDVISCLDQTTYDYLDSAVSERYARDPGGAGR